MGSKVETLWQAALTTDLNARRLLKQNRFLTRFAFLSPAAYSECLLLAPLPQSAEPLRRSRDSAPAKPAGEGGLGTCSWEVPRLPEPEPPAAGSARRLAAGEGSLGRTGLRPGGLQTPRG